MPELLALIDNLARLILYLGGGVFTIAVCVAGFFYMTAFGDPQKQNTARGALVGAFVGICIMGISFMAPRIMSQYVLEPAGLEPIADVAVSGCDTALQSTLVTHRSISTGSTVNGVIREVQAQKASECSSDIWAPKVRAAGVGGGAVGSSGFTANVCYKSGSWITVGDSVVPASLANVAGARQGTSDVYGAVARDSEGNMLIEFHPQWLPTNGANCWFYSSKSGRWDVGYGASFSGSPGGPAVPTPAPTTVCNPHDPGFPDC